MEYISLLSNVAEVEWQLNPDGRYCRDDDGYGMTDDEEIAVYGFIDAAECTGEIPIYRRQ